MIVGMSQIKREWNELEAATDLLARAVDLGESAGFPQFPYRWRVADAQLRMHRGDLDGALALLADAEARHVGDMFPNVRSISALRARVWIAQGRLDDAQAWANAHAISDRDDISFVGMFGQLTLARIFLARTAMDGNAAAAEAAMRLLERLRAAAEAGDWTRDLIETLVLQALGNFQMGNRAAALAALERALSLAEPGGAVRVFVDEGEPMRQMLLSVAGGSRGRFAQRLLRSWSIPDRTTTGLVASPALVVQLTPREIEILRLIAAGLRNQQIANQLYISLPTVKRHVANAYGKLGVSHRTEAIARATALGRL